MYQFRFILGQGHNQIQGPSANYFHKNGIKKDYNEIYQFRLGTCCNPPPSLKALMS